MDSAFHLDMDPLQLFRIRFHPTAGWPFLLVSAPKPLQAKASGEKALPCQCCSAKGFLPKWKQLDGKGTESVPAHTAP